MKTATWLLPIAGVFAVTLASLPAQAVPLGALEAVQTSATDGANVIPVHSRYHYWRHRHHRPYRYYRSHRPGVHFYVGPRRHDRDGRHWR